MDESQTIRISVEEAATLLGIEKGSVKKRIQRGKLQSEKDATGVTWVYLDRSETVQDESQGRSETDRDELVVELRDRVRSLERRLDDEGESRRRADTIIAQLTQANAALAEQLRELEALTDDNEPDTPQEAEDGPVPERSRLNSLFGVLAGITALVSFAGTLLAAGGGFVYSILSAIYGDQIIAIVSALIGLLGSIGAALITILLTRRRRDQ